MEKETSKRFATYAPVAYKTFAGALVGATVVFLFSSLAILAVGTAVDLLRDRLFRALGVPRLAKRIARLAESCFAKLFP